MNHSTLQNFKNSEMELISNAILVIREYINDLDRIDLDSLFSDEKWTIELSDGFFVEYISEKGIGVVDECCESQYNLNGFTSLKLTDLCTIVNNLESYAYHIFLRNSR